MTKDYPWGKGTLKISRDATANDSDKSFTVPTGKIWDLRKIYAFFGSTATVGNRLLVVRITDGTNTICELKQVGTQAASLGYHYLFEGDRNPNNFAATNAEMYGPLGLNILPAGYVVRIWDEAAVDAAADDLTVVLHYIEYDA